MIRKKCLICQTDLLSRIIDLGLHPYADSFIPENMLHKIEPIFPLCCDLCNNCGHVQTSYITNPIERYSLYDYAYTSSNSSTSIRHWSDYAKHISSRLNLDKDFIVEVGSNDGLLCELLYNMGNKVLGIDASPHMAKLASNRQVKTLTGLFDESMKFTILQNGKPRLIIANNVFNHAEDPLSFAQLANSLVQDKGFFVFECPYWMEAIRSKRFDQIYHEHVSYFTIKSVKDLLKRSGLNITNVEFVDYHGGSIRVFAQKNGKDMDTTSIISTEETMGSFKPETYEDLMDIFIDKRAKIMTEILDNKNRGKTVIAVGAAAKGNTFLNFIHANNTIIDYVTDRSKEKQGKYTPLSRIPIRSDNIFKRYNKPAALILSWNISEQIKTVLRNINDSISFIGENNE